MQATVLVTHLRDARLSNAVDSALRQGRLLREVIIADGGSPDAIIEDLQERYKTDPRVKILRLPGSVAKTRQEALRAVQGDVVAFLDSDEKAPEGWLARLVEPILKDEADFTGGPTRPLAPPTSAAERYVNQVDHELYKENVPQDLSLLPMGNSAWKTSLLRSIGGFDPRLSWGGEDYDVNLRALNAKARGRFVPEAWVWHDQSHLNRFSKILRRKYRYYVGAATAYMKNDALGTRTRRSAARFRIRHPIDLLDLVLKPAALVKARSYYRRAFSAKATR